jgi:hypothetical protein
VPRKANAEADTPAHPTSGTAPGGCPPASPVDGRERNAESLDDSAFSAFVDEVGDLPLDCVLEVKDKEQSTLRALELLRASSRSDARGR